MSDRQEADKVDLRSADIAEDKRLELLRLFPEVRTEGGKIDFARLKLALGETVDVGRERYGMNWPGKAFPVLYGGSMHGTNRGTRHFSHRCLRRSCSFGALQCGYSSGST